MKIKFINLKEALALHKKVTRIYGEKTGIRDRKLLESALLQPQTKLL